ncbi:MAG: DUF6817 domain-containing protein [Acidimicrobiia bacterium]
MRTDSSCESKESKVAAAGSIDHVRRTQALRLLRDRGAAEIEHVNGCLLDHLERTEGRLRSWGCSETVSIAGLCHATYGTDGFATALMGLDERDLLSAAVGRDVEALVYLYASCDRGFVYPSLAKGAAFSFRNRYTTHMFSPSDRQVQDFVDLTLANESDVGTGGSRAEDVPEWLISMYDQFHTFASESVQYGFRHDVERQGAVG